MEHVDLYGKYFKPTIRTINIIENLRERIGGRIREGEQTAKFAEHIEDEKVKIINEFINNAINNAWITTVRKKGQDMMPHEVRKLIMDIIRNKADEYGRIKKYTITQRTQYITIQQRNDAIERLEKDGIIAMIKGEKAANGKHTIFIQLIKED